MGLSPDVKPRLLINQKRLPPKQRPWPYFSAIAAGVSLAAIIALFSFSTPVHAATGTDQEAEINTQTDANVKAGQASGFTYGTADKEKSLVQERRPTHKQPNKKADQHKEKLSDMQKQKSAARHSSEFDHGKVLHDSDKHVEKGHNKKANLEKKHEHKERRFDKKHEPKPGYKDKKNHDIRYGKKDPKFDPKERGRKLGHDKSKKDDKFDPKERGGKIGHDKRVDKKHGHKFGHHNKKADHDKKHHDKDKDIDKKNRKHRIHKSVVYHTHKDQHFKKLEHDKKFEHKHDRKFEHNKKFKHLAKKLDRKHRNFEKKDRKFEHEDRKFDRDKKFEHVAKKFDKKRDGKFEHGKKDRKFKNIDKKVDKKRDHKFDRDKQERKFDRGKKFESDKRDRKFERKHDRKNVHLDKKIERVKKVYVKHSKKVRTITHEVSHVFKHEPRLSTVKVDTGQVLGVGGAAHLPATLAVTGPAGAGGNLLLSFFSSLGIGVGIQALYSYRRSLKKLLKLDLIK